MGMWIADMAPHSHYESFPPLSYVINTNTNRRPNRTQKFVNCTLYLCKSGRVWSVVSNSNVPFLIFVFVIILRCRDNKKGAARCGSHQPYNYGWLSKWQPAVSHVVTLRRCVLYRMLHSVCTIRCLEEALRTSGRRRATSPPPCLRLPR